MCHFFPSQKNKKCPFDFWAFEWAVAFQFVSLETQEADGLCIKHRVWWSNHDHVVDQFQVLREQKEELPKYICLFFESNGCLFSLLFRWYYIIVCGWILAFGCVDLIFIHWTLKPLTW